MYDTCLTQLNMVLGGVGVGVGRRTKHHWAAGIRFLVWKQIFYVSDFVANPVNLLLCLGLCLLIPSIYYFVVSSRLG